VNSDERLAQIVSALESVGLDCIVMGGHAVRYYGIERTTIDFDLHLAPDSWKDLPAKLAQTALFGEGMPTEGNSWRPESFRRFLLGRLPDLREEWLEFWRGNHLLAPFSELLSRAEKGPYGGRTLKFLSLADLIRSKESERLSDWEDIEQLEEIQDHRALAAAQAGSLRPEAALSGLRSRVGLERAMQAGLLSDAESVAAALAQAKCPVTQALLTPFAPSASWPSTVPAIEVVVANHLRTTPPASPLHWTLVEAVRRQYRLAGQAADRADKERIRASQQDSTS
jgi:hypothetical protein